MAILTQIKAQIWQFGQISAGKIVKSLNYKIIKATLTQKTAKISGFLRFKAKLSLGRNLGFNFNFKF